MTRGKALFLGAFIVLLMVPSFVSADYLYPGSAALQPLAVIEPTTPDSLFYSWTGEIDQYGRSNLGTSLDFLRNKDNSDDWDVILSITGAFRSGEKLVYGLTVPYIIRDPELNESDLLDLRAFARMTLLDGASGFNISGELSAILPTADQGTLYPFTLDTPVVGARIAFSSGAMETRIGMNVGYQKYLQTVSGDDSDLIYSLWMERPFQGPWNLTAEYTGTTHSHSGTPGDEDVADAYLSVGMKRVQSEKIVLGFSAASGVGGDSVADIKIKALAQMKFGAVEKKKVQKEKKVRKKEPKKKTKAKSKVVAPRIIAVMIAEAVTTRDVEKRITKALQQKGYATGMDPDPGIKNKGKNVLYYMPGMQEAAIKVSRTLSFGGYLSDLRIEESPVPITGNWLLLVLGGEK